MGVSKARSSRARKEGRVQHLYTLLCNYAFAEADSGRYSFFGVFQNIEIGQEPGSIPQFYIAVGVRGEPGTEIQLAIANAAGDWQRRLPKGTIPETPGGAAENRLSIAMVVMLLPNFEFPAAGDYEVRLLEAGELVHAAPFRVRLVERAVASITPTFGASGLAGKTRLVASAAEPSFPTVSHKPSPAGARFIEHLRSLRQGDKAEQSKTWEQLEEALTEDHLL